MERSKEVAGGGREGKDHYQMMDFATMAVRKSVRGRMVCYCVTRGGGWKVRVCTETRLPATEGLRGRTVRSYLAGQLAGAQAVLHGKRLGHVGHRLVELLQVALVLHLRGDTGPPHTCALFHEQERFLKQLKLENAYLTRQRVGILQRLVNLTLFQVILWFLSFHLLVKLLLILHLFGLDMSS